MKINYVIPSIASGHPASAGSLCLYEYINGLSRKGHEVTVVPLEYYGEPDKNILFLGKVIRPRHAVRINMEIKRLAKGFLRKVCPPVVNWLESRRTAAKNRSSYIRRRFKLLSEAINSIPVCDVNIATCYQSALAVYLSGKGTQFYHLQHFERYFCNDFTAPDFALHDASLTYQLPLIKIVNCTWLKKEVEKHYPHEKIAGVVNYGINTNIFFPRKKTKDSSRIKVISYGGRSFIWKGFMDAVHAMKIVRKWFPEIEWIVFGDTSIPPKNDIASFEAKGFLTHDKLADLYSECDIMLCPSWYESFPLYPLEAMACGLSVVTTPLGTEDYAKDGENCLIVRAQSPDSMANAVIKLINDESLRKRLGREGIKTAQKFKWEESVDEMEKLIIDNVTLLPRNSSNPKE